MGAPAVSKILYNYCKDYKYWNHGMPDLIVWSDEKAKFSEVKSGSDRLSEVQIAWLEFFNKNGIEAEVCYINRSEESEDGQQAKPIEVFTAEMN